MKSIYKLFLRPQRWLLATVAAAVASKGPRRRVAGPSGRGKGRIYCRILGAL